MVKLPVHLILRPRFQSLWKQFIPLCFSHIQPRSLNQRNSLCCLRPTIISTLPIQQRHKQCMWSLPPKILRATSSWGTPHNLKTRIMGLLEISLPIVRMPFKYIMRKTALSLLSSAWCKSLRFLTGIILLRKQVWTWSTLGLYLRSLFHTMMTRDSQRVFILPSFL